MISGSRTDQESEAFSLCLGSPVNKDSILFLLSVKKCFYSMCFEYLTQCKFEPLCIAEIQIEKQLITERIQILLKSMKILPLTLPGWDLAIVLLNCIVIFRWKLILMFLCRFSCL